MCCIIAILFLSIYVMLACSYTIESFINVKLVTKYWYVFPFVLLWCIMIGWIYFPCDLGFKLNKKLNDTKN